MNNCQRCGREVPDNIMICNECMGYGYQEERNEYQIYEQNNRNMTIFCYTDPGPGPRDHRDHQGHKGGKSRCQFHIGEIASEAIALLYVVRCFCGKLPYGEKHGKRL